MNGLMLIKFERTRNESPVLLNMREVSAVTEDRQRCAVVEMKNGTTYVLGTTLDLFMAKLAGVAES